MRALWVFCGLLATGLALGESEAFTVPLEVTIEGATPATGNAVVAVFDSKSTYMKSPVVQSSTPVDASGRVVVMFDDLKPGEYAVTIYHDANGNGELDTGLFGPKEKFGFSNNAKGRFGPAAFAKAKVVVTGPMTRITIQLAGV